MAKRTKNLIKCTVCYQKGENKTLCEVFEDGVVAVQRVNDKKKDYTIIKGTAFQVICANCGETIYFYTANGEIH